MDVLTAKDATTGILAALRHRDRAGQGQLVEVNLLSPLLGLTGQSGVRPSRHRPRSGPDGQPPPEHRPVRDAGLPRRAAAGGGGGQ
ncbi:CoA transferase [Streptomyces glebosus]|uniref:CoA transferase n=1 Tax=Streptomyces glebosus TaxID=249580 RepID=UPI0027E59ADF|nr:CoA transferase [Streptomyces glebosus]